MFHFVFQWLSVQELWQCLEEVFSNSATAKVLQSINTKRNQLISILMTDTHLLCGKLSRQLICWEHMSVCFPGKASVRSISSVLPLLGFMKCF